MTDRNNYASLEFCIKLLYDKVYNPKSDKCYMFQPLIKSNIRLETLKRIKYHDTTEIWTKKLVYYGFFNDKWVFHTVDDLVGQCFVFISKYERENINDLA